MDAAFELSELSGRLAAVSSGVQALTLVEAGLAVTAALLLMSIGLLALLLRRSRRDPAGELSARFDELQRGQERADRMLREELARSREEFGGHTRHLREEVSGAVRHSGETVEKRLEDVRGVLDSRLQRLHEENQKKLEQMRATVDEKLQGTLEKRLGEAFQQVSERLEAVHKGLGEMQSLAIGVGDLQKVLSNVKTRGTFGETRLEALLEQTLAPGQWQRQVQVKKGSAERVDFVVVLPGPEGRDGEPVLLPLDAKFPQEDYERLIDAQEAGDAAAAEAAAKALELGIKGEARRLRNKYVNPPTTTDFAVLFLPTEGLYAEVLRRPGLVECLQRDCSVTVSGPTTVLALLNSLQMGFRSLAIQKRSSEVWSVLGAVKTEFGRFGKILERVDKKLQEASNTIQDASSKSRNIERKLGRVETLPESDSSQLLLPKGD